MRIDFTTHLFVEKDYQYFSAAKGGGEISVIIVYENDYFYTRYIDH